MINFFKEKKTITNNILVLALLIEYKLLQHKYVVKLQAWFRSNKARHDYKTLSKLKRTFILLSLAQQ